MRFDLARLRKKLNLSQKELAEKLGIRQSFLSAIETGKSPLPADKRLMLAKLSEPESLEDYIIENSAESTHGHNQQNFGAMSETGMLKELLNYFHTQAHRDQDKHHENMHLQLDSFQHRNDRLQKKNDELTDKIQNLSDLVEQLRTELHSTRTENLHLKELLIKNNISYK